MLGLYGFIGGVETFVHPIPEHHRFRPSLNLSVASRFVEVLFEVAERPACFHFGFLWSTL